MILQAVVIRHFKRFGTVRFELPSHTVVVGPNNSGKSTLLQAIAAWDLGFRRWSALADFQRHGGAYSYAPIARPDFSAVPVRRFDLLWKDRRVDDAAEIELHLRGQPAVTMEFRHDTTEQIKVRPKADVTPDVLRRLKFSAVFVPPMTGLQREEREYARQETIDDLLAQGRPGEVLRNLLLAAHRDHNAWVRLTEAIKRLFDADLLPPQPGAMITCEYTQGGNTRLDIASAGSGFQQVLMLLTFLHTRPGAVLLVDEPDAHLHVFLQDAIYSELRRIAGQNHSQLVLATHSEVIMDSVDVGELTMLLDGPRPLASVAEKRNLTEALRILSHTDILRAQGAKGVLYVEGRTDLDILREWARVLGHPALPFLEGELFWKPTVYSLRDGGEGITSGEHYKALRLVRDMPALEVVDGDAGRGRDPTPITGRGFQRIRWNRYEIENYLFHPAVLARFVSKEVGDAASGPAIDALNEHLKGSQPPRFLENPHEDLPFLAATKGREILIPPALQAAGLYGVNYTRFHEIAGLMKPEEVHPEVKEKLDAIQKAFGL